MKNLSIHKLTLSALLCALALITFTLENLFPPLFLPGARLGLSNIFILLLAILLNSTYAYFALIIKTFVGSIFAGNISMVLYSLPSGLIALTIELILLHFTKKTSVVCISVVGAVINTSLQNITFCLISGFTEYLVYLPYLALIAIPSGIIVGLCVYLTIKRLPLANYF